MIPTLPGITAVEMRTRRLRTRVLFSGRQTDTPVLFLHGNYSSATWWEEVMLALPAGFRGIAADQRGFGESDPHARINATRGMGDLVDDALALIDDLGLPGVHVVGNSLGGYVVWNMLRCASPRVISASLIAPGSPYGFGGTKGAHGTLCSPDAAGSGAGLINDSLIQAIVGKDRSLEGVTSPRNVMRTYLFSGRVPGREEDLLSAFLAVHIGDRDQPGDRARSPHWPYWAPGIWGAANALSPKYGGDADELLRVSPKPPIVWIRGDRDSAISDCGASDPGRLGEAGLIPGWPGREVFPPQPMVAQTRCFLERYAQAGGSYHEAVIVGAGHVPFVEDLDTFNRVWHPFLRSFNTP
jgi:pimeloyl-ACP methyl ester carboxylesterase